MIDGLIQKYSMDKQMPRYIDVDASDLAAMKQLWQKLEASAIDTGVLNYMHAMLVFPQSTEATVTVRRSLLLAWMDEVTKFTMLLS